MKKWIFLIGCLLCMTNVYAQDIHFSQFDQSSYIINPGYTGQFNGRYRFHANQRTQWRSITTPYSTFGIWADAPIEYRIPFNAGLCVVSDVTGDSRMRTTVVNISLSKNIPLNEEETMRFVPGIQFGISNLSIDYSQLNYDNQWNGYVFDPNIDPQETFARDARTHFNFNAGGVFYYDIDDQQSFNAGISLYNMNAPKQSYFNDSFVRLDARLNINAGYKYRINDQWDVSPGLLFMSQGKYKEFDLGGLAYYHFERKAWMAQSVFAGVYGRAKDAGFIIAGMQYYQWRVGLSYDINTSNLRPASNGRGGLEFSVVYIVPALPKIKPGAPRCSDYL